MRWLLGEFWISDNKAQLDTKAIAQHNQGASHTHMSKPNMKKTQEKQPVALNAAFLTDGGNCYFLHEGVLFDAPMMQDGTIGLINSGPVGFQDGISEENVAYCLAIESALKLLAIRDRSENGDTSVAEVDCTLDATAKFVIYSVEQRQENPDNFLGAYWSEHDAWGSLETATRFTAKERMEFHLFVTEANDAEWMLEEEARDLSGIPKSTDDPEVNVAITAAPKTTIVQAVEALALAAECGGENDQPYYEETHRAMQQLIQKIIAFDKKLNDREVAPTGNDYNALIEILGISCEDYQKPNPSKAVQAVKPVTPADLA